MISENLKGYRLGSGSGHRKGRVLKASKAHAKIRKSNRYLSRLRMIRRIMVDIAFRTWAFSATLSPP